MTAIWTFLTTGKPWAILGLILVSVLVGKLVVAAYESAQ